MDFLNDVSEMNFGKTTRHFEVSAKFINELYDEKYLHLPDRYISDSQSQGDDDVLWPNQTISLTSIDSNQSALALVCPEGLGLVPAKSKLSYEGIAPRNREQTLLFNLLDDPDIRVLIITGPAGTGKSLCTSAYALNQVLSEKNYEKMILSKPLEIVTSTRYWGTVPGDEGDKFGPFLKSFAMTFENIVGKDGARYLETATKNNVIEFMPLELMRGASLRNALVWYDEAQNLNKHEAATLGTRIDDDGGSKLILSGDLNQRDRNIKRTHTGLHHLTTHRHFLASPLTAHIDLRIIERGAVAELFHNVFEEDPID